MKGLLRKDLYLMIKYCRLFFILIIVFPLPEHGITICFLHYILLQFPALSR